MNGDEDESSDDDDAMVLQDAQMHLFFKMQSIIQSDIRTTFSRLKISHIVIS
jgi:hypothetical protein